MNGIAVFEGICSNCIKNELTRERVSQYPTSTSELQGREAGGAVTLLCPGDTRLFASPLPTSHLYSVTPDLSKFIYGKHITRELTVQQIHEEPRGIRSTELFIYILHAPHLL